MENLELDVDTLRHGVIDRLDDSWDSDGGEGDGAEGDEALERAECDRDHSGGIFRLSGRRRSSVRQPSLLKKNGATTMLVCK